MNLHDQLAALPAKERDSLLRDLGYVKKRAAASKRNPQLVERKPPRLTDAKRVQVAEEWRIGAQRWADYSHAIRQDRLDEARILARRNLGWY